MAEGNKLPTAPDAFTKAGRNHHAMRDNGVVTKHGRDKYHIETMKLKAQFSEASGAAGEGPGKKHEKMHLIELDITKGRDGESPDAQCLAAAYDQVFDVVFQKTTGDTKCDAARDAKGPDDWIQKMIACSFDGASVNTGTQNGLISFWMVRAVWVLMFHAVAHVVELIAKDAWKAVPYYAEVLDAICRRNVVSTYHRSGKTARLPADSGRAAWGKA